MLGLIVLSTIMIIDWSKNKIKIKPAGRQASDDVEGLGKIVTSDKFRKD
jgi:hypothetical protein